MLFLASVSFRGIPWSSGVHVRGSGAAARSSIDAFPGNIRTLGGPRPILASVGLRRVHVRGSGTVTQSSNNVSAWDIRILGGGPYDIFGFRELPRCPGLSM